jgi:hypothetical protein
VTRPLRRLLATLLALAPAAARAQGTEGEVCLEGEAGGRLQVEAQGRTLGPALEAASGRTCVAGVPAGFVRVVHEEGRTAALPLDLLPGERVTLAVSAEGALSVRRRGRATLGTGFDAQWLRDLPAAGEPWSLLETVEPVVIADRIDGGGLFAGTPGRLSTHGSSWMQATFTQGALDVTDPLRLGLPLTWPALFAFDGLDVATASLPAGAGAPGAFVALQPAAPSERWTLSAAGSAVVNEGRRAGGAVSTPIDGPEPPAARFGHQQRYDLRAAGPLGARLRGAFSGGFNDTRRFEYGQAEPLDAYARTLGAQLLWLRGPGSTLRLQGDLQRLERPFEGRFLFAERGLQERDHLGGGQLEWQARRPSGLLATAALGYRAARSSADGGSAPGTAERLLRGPIDDLPLPGLTYRRRIDAALGLQRAPWSGAGGVHALRVGLQAARTGAHLEPFTEPVAVGELLDGRPARAWTFAAFESRWSGTDLALHATDSATFGRALEMEAGLRLETSGASAEGVEGRLRWTALSPRLNLRWHATGGLTLFGSYGHYRHRLPLGLLAWGDPSARTGTVRLWTDDGDGVFEEGEKGPLVARRGPGAPIGARDAGLAPPRTEEVVAGAEVRFGSWRVAFQGVHRDERNLVESVNVGVPDDRYDVVTVLDPGGDIVGPQDDQLLPIFVRDPATYGADALLLTNPAGHETKHQGAEITVEYLKPRLRVLLGATAHRSDGSGAWRGFRPAENDQGGVGDLFDDPNTRTFARGRLFSDRAYTIKLTGTWQAPFGLRLGGAARYQDGQPFARLVIAELPEGPTAVQAIPNGRARFTYALTLDARIEKSFAVGSRARLSAVAEGFNLSQRGHEVEEVVVSGSAYRRVTFRQPPLAVRLGLRLGF